MRTPSMAVAASLLPGRAGLAAGAPTMAARSMRSCPLTHLVVDFDGTCTDGDTTPIVPYLAAHAAPSSADSIHAEFQRQEATYFGLLEEAKARLDLASAPSADLDVASLDAHLAALDEASLIVTRSLSASSALSGIRAADVGSALSSWSSDSESAPVRLPSLRPGCAATLAAAAARGCSLSVLSLNWCPPLVRWYLPVLDSAPGGASSAPGLGLLCNEIDEAGVVHTRVRGAADKRAAMEQFVAAAGGAPPSGGGGGDGEGSRTGGIVAYVGDSATDLPALLEADVGILIGESASARSIAARYGIRLLPLPRTGPCPPPGASAGGGAAEAPSGGRGVLWEASCWEDIGVALGLQEGE